MAVILLSSTFALAQGINFREKIPINKSLAEFPLKLSEWSGVRQSMGQRLIDRLDLSDYAIVDYYNPKKRIVHFYLAYYESQRKGESIHSPSTCLPGSGWIFNQAGATNIDIPGYNDGSMRVNRAFMQKNGYKQLAYYWFPQRGRILTNAYQLKIFAFWDALTKQRTDGALVRVITPVYESEQLQDAEVRLQAFTRTVVPLLAEYIPGKDL
jgi:EpsI family protein